MMPIKPPNGVGEKELELAVLRELRDTLKPSVADKVKIAARWISHEYKACLILNFIGLMP
ncbi:MAG: putative transposase [Clostridiales bacterium]|nr:putative transposase [Clostridiales bacterium]